MDPTSFSISRDIDSFTGPGGIDLRTGITGFSWLNGNTTLEVTFTPLAPQGAYTMTVGPAIFSAAGIAMDQDQNGLAGEAGADAYTGIVRYDYTPLQVASTGPANGGILEISTATTLDIHFNNPIDPATVNVNNLTLSQGTVTAATVIDSTTVRYTLGGIISEGMLTFSMAAGVPADLNGNPLIAYSGQFTVDIATAPFPTLAATNPPGSLIYMQTLQTRSIPPATWIAIRST